MSRHTESLTEAYMSISKAGGLNFQAKLDAANFAKTRTVDAKQGSVAAQNSGQVSQKAKDTKTSKTPSEGFTLSEAAQKALEDAALEDGLEQAKAGMADEANQTHGKSKTKENEDRKSIAQGRVEQKDGTRVFELDDEDGASYEVSKAEGERMDALDRRSPQNILDGMPDSSRIPAEATVRAQGPVKLAKALKDDPKVSAITEQMDLEPADPEWKKNTLAAIRTPKDEPPLQFDDPNSELMAKEAAIRMMQSGGGELMIA
jgi:hypothetical protein